MNTLDQEAASTAAEGPELKFKEDSWDFGKIKQGDIVKHYFVFSNTGDLDLVLKDVRTSCGCTAANVADKKISPSRHIPTSRLSPRSEINRYALSMPMSHT